MSIVVIDDYDLREMDQTGRVVDILNVTNRMIVAWHGRSSHK